MNTENVWIDNGAEKIDIRSHTDYLKCFFGEAGEYKLYADIPGYKDPAVDFELTSDNRGKPLHDIKPYILRLQKKRLIDRD